MHRSHSYFDHVGGEHKIYDRLNHAAEVDFLAAPDRRKTLIREYIAAKNFTAAPLADFDADAYAVPAEPPTRLVSDGDVIDLGDRHFEAPHLPGHSPGGIALWEAATGTLFSGDVV